MAIPIEEISRMTQRDIDLEAKYADYISKHYDSDFYKGVFQILSERNIPVVENILNDVLYNFNENNVIANEEKFSDKYEEYYGVYEYEKSLA